MKIELSVEEYHALLAVAKDQEKLCQETFLNFDKNPDIKHRADLGRKFWRDLVAKLQQQFS